MIKNKKAMSEIIAYVLLIVLAISLSLVVYAWLKSYIVKPEKNCPEGVSISLEEYSCKDKIISLNVKNNGLFNIDGYVVRVGNTTKGKAVYYLKNRGLIENYLPGKKALEPGEKFDSVLNYKDYGVITRIEIQPFEVDKEIIMCSDAIIKQELENC